MAVLLGAGLTAEAALEAVQGAAGSTRIERLAAEARAGLLEGEALADALGRAGGALPAFYAAAVRAGEQSGDLDAVFETLAEHLETSAGDRAAITSALVYPAFVTLVAIVVCAILMTTVAPEIIGMFESTGRPLPPLTVTVMGIVDFIRDHWLALLIALALVVAMIMTINRTPPLRDRRDGVLLRLPLIGRFMRMATAAQYLAMAFHELATNAMKHGALARPEGEVTVRWLTSPRSGRETPLYAARRSAKPSGGTQHQPAVLNSRVLSRV